METSNVKWTIIGSLCVTMYAILTTLNQVVIKASNLSIVQCAVGRFGVQLVLAILWWNLKRPSKPYLSASLNENTDAKIEHWYGDPPFIANIWLRGFLYASNQFIFYISLILLPIGDDQCILYQSPLLIVYFSAIILKEKLPEWYILSPATLMTICGILLISQPVFVLQLIDREREYEPLNIYGLITACVSAINWVPIVLLIRKARDAHFLQLEFASSGCVCFVTLPLTLVLNHYWLHIEFIGSFDINEWSFDGYSIAIMIGLGFCGFAQILCSVIGYQMGNATYVSWLEYITIPIGFLYQTIIFNDAPNKYEIIGGTLVTIGCLMPFTKQLWIYFHSETQGYERVEQESEATSEEETSIEMIDRS
eukprot:1164040_1